MTESLNSRTQLIEWGPAHLREEAARPEVDIDDRPDDN